MKPGLVSIILPFFNGRRFIRDAIESVLGQSYAHYELLVIDDGSSNSIHSSYCNALIKEYADPRIAYELKPNAGLSATRNYGIEKSAGEYIAFLDQDDVWRSAKLSAQIDAFQQNSGTMLVCSTGVSIGNCAKRLAAGEDAHIPTGIVKRTFSQMLKKNIVIASSVMFRRSLHDVTPGSNREFFVCPDYELFLRYAQFTDFYFINEPLVEIRWHEQNTTKRRLKLELELVQALAAAPLPRLLDRLVYLFRIVLSLLKIFYYTLPFRPRPEIGSK
jgi:glycosyltransferase involved in cell wall biosynthesis